jgi:uncharacterized surface protein with fasciclin (FAS1) repeats
VFEGRSSGLDNAKHARIRIAHAVMGAPTVDVYVNGMPAVNGGVTQQNIPDGQMSGWLYVEPGTYTVALVPHGATMDKALFAPVAVEAVASKRYTVVMIGQLEDQDVRPLVVDELALAAAVGAKPTDNFVIEVNNLKGAAGIDELVNGTTVATIPYGEARAVFCDAAFCKEDTVHAATIVTGQPATILGEGDLWIEPAASPLILNYGTDPTTANLPGLQSVSELNVLDFLAAYNGRQVVANGHLLTFNTVLAAIDKAGMRDQFANSGPYFFFAPTDEAFAALPKDQRDALLNDPEALTQLLKAHVVEGYYPYGSISGVVYGQTDREVTNRLGQNLSVVQVGDGLGINGLYVMGGNYTVGNGNRVNPIETLLPSQ